MADDVLGYLVEVVSGMPLNRFLDERLFKPLGMKDTGFFLPPEKVSRLAGAYTYYPEKGLQPFRDQQIIEEGSFVCGLSLPRSPDLFLRWWRPLLERRGLLPFLPDDAEWWEIWSQANPKQKIGGVDLSESYSEKVRNLGLRSRIWSELAKPDI